MTRILICVAAAVIVAVAASGCTERERAGYSSIPQNSPTAWDLNPFGGEIRN